MHDWHKRHVHEVCFRNFESAISSRQIAQLFQEFSIIGGGKSDSAESLDCVILFGVNLGSETISIFDKL